MIVSIGRLTEEKGQIYLIKAFSGIVSEYPGAKLLFVGDGPLRSFLESEARSLELENNVIFAGIRNDIPEMLIMADIFVCHRLKKRCRWRCLRQWRQNAHSCYARWGGFKYN